LSCFFPAPGALVDFVVGDCVFLKVGAFVSTGAAVVVVGLIIGRTEVGVAVGVAVELAVGVAMGVAVELAVGVAVGASVELAVGVAVGIADGIAVILAVGVEVLGTSVGGEVVGSNVEGSIVERSERSIEASPISASSMISSTSILDINSSPFDFVAFSLFIILSILFFDFVTLSLSSFSGSDSLFTDLIDFDLLFTDFALGLSLSPFFVDFDFFFTDLLLDFISFTMDLSLDSSSTNPSEITTGALVTSTTGAEVTLGGSNVVNPIPRILLRSPLPATPDDTDTTIINNSKEMR